MSPRRGYTHHGIYVGGDTVVQYGGFDSDEVVRRARSRLGEDNYHPLTNNCEHFCEWCVRGQQRSYQVDELLSRPGQALRLTIRLVAKLLYVRNSTVRSSSADEAASN